ncbi:monothiol glutaredoxin-6 [[Candida] railenensis]|uniref:Monothiol glutaredoxin-6 n=1 Tax=[Candida] railenensis TaxID=45579 RepID=A0A9P0QQ94_9ASCO|nr:monothiol glutaredoxin-6 [[Candida] railenensis]
MLNPRKLRVIGLAVFSILLLVLLFHTHSSKVGDSVANVQTLVTSNNLVESTNDEKLDAAINSEISKLGKENEESEDEATAKDAVAKGSGSGSAGSAKVGGVGTGDAPNSKNQAAITEEDGSFDPVQELLSIRALAPMVVFSKTFCPYSKKLKKLLKENYQITPVPAFVELDKHKHGAELQKYLGQITERKTVPNVLVGSSSISRGGADDFVKLHEDGTLIDLLKQWGSKGLDVKRVEAPSNV